ncbi:MAG: hypothetical protein AAFY17_01840 [Cyanobacteria bacterium J06642_11]
MIVADVQPDWPDYLLNRNYTLIYAPTRLRRPGRTPGFEHRWQDAHGHIMSMADCCHQLADSGLRVYCKSTAEDDFYLHRSVDRVNLAALMASTPLPDNVVLAPVLATVFEQYFAEKAAGQQPANGEIILILVDSEPVDRLEIAKQIVAASHQLDHHDEIGIGWIQVGDDFITKGFLVTLDDNLRDKGAKFDIVDHKTIAQMAAMDVSSFLTHVLRD